MNDPKDNQENRSTRTAAPDSNASLARALTRIKEERGEDELVFDPVSGTLRVVRPGEAPASVMPATKMAEEGFFARHAVVYAAELRQWMATGAARSSGLVFFRDEDVLHHALASPADWRRTGRAAEALAVRAELEADPAALVGPGGTARHVLVVAGSAEAPSVRSWSRGQGRWEEDALAVVPAAEAFARNEGILESHLLAGKKVAVVGLGSGGAVIASELAKAGVGAFVLADQDRLEVHNVGRHLCDLRDLGRLKTRAVRDHLLARNPHAHVELLEGDVLADEGLFESVVRDADVLVAATDNNASRRLVNRVAVDQGVSAIFGRAFERACGGDVIRYQPGGPCYECLVGRGAGSSPAVPSVGRKNAYSDAPVVAEPGLALDIAPISLMCTRLVLQELVRGTGSGLEALNGELDAPVYVWANRREAQFRDWTPLGATVGGLTVMRWYGSRAERRPGCPTCDAEGWMAEARRQSDGAGGMSQQGERR